MTRFAAVVVLAALLSAALAAPAGAGLSDKLGALTADNAKGYLTPLPKALSSTLNAGIFPSGRIPKTGFGLTVGVRVMGVSFGDADKTYTPTDPPGFTSNSPTAVPTVIGDPAGALVGGQGGTNEFYPGGLDVSQFTLAVPEVTVQSAFGTRLVGRWFSATLGSSDYGKLELFGIGGQHSISQYFPKLPADVAVGVFYQTFKLGDGLLDTKALHLDVTASRQVGKLVKVEPYVSLGYDTFSMDVSYKSTTDPTNDISLSMDKQSNVHLAAGAQLLLPVVKLQAEVFTAANSGASIGLSFGY